MQKFFSGPSTNRAQAPASRRSRKIFAFGKPWQNLKLIITEVFYSQFLNMTKVPSSRSFRRIYLSVFRFRLTKNGFIATKSFRGVRETAHPQITFKPTRSSSYRMRRPLVATFISLVIIYKLSECSLVITFDKTTQTKDTVQSFENLIILILRLIYKSFTIIMKERC